MSRDCKRCTSDGDSFSSILIFYHFVSFVYHLLSGLAEAGWGGVRVACRANQMSLPWEAGLPDWRRVKNVSTPVIPAKAGSQNFKQNKPLWFPAFAGMSGKQMSGMGAAGRRM